MVTVREFVHRRTRRLSRPSGRDPRSVSACGSTDAAQLPRSVERQANVAGLRFEADLINTLLDAVADEPGGMSLLQPLLRRLWERRRGRWLRAEEYRTLGGPAAMLASAAESVYLDSEETERAQNSQRLLAPCSTRRRPTSAWTPVVAQPWMIW